MVHERTKKVTTHCVKYVSFSSLCLCWSHPHTLYSRFGDEIERAAQRIKKVSRTNTKPLVTFVFKYKSLGTFPICLGLSI
jgi:hypothetical protein